MDHADVESEFVVVHFSGLEVEVSEIRVQGGISGLLTEEMGRVLAFLADESHWTDAVRLLRAGASVEAAAAIIS